jgi:hypothetical protein
VSLSRSERRALRRVEAGISLSDPRLARLLEGFDDLAAGHAMFHAERRRLSAAAGLAFSAARMAGHGCAAVASAISVPGCGSGWVSASDSSQWAAQHGSG